VVPHVLHSVGVRIALNVGAAQVFKEGWDVKPGQAAETIPSIPNVWVCCLDESMWQGFKFGLLNLADFSVKFTSNDEGFSQLVPAGEQVAVVQDRSSGAGSTRVLFWEVIMLDPHAPDAEVVKEIERRNPLMSGLQSQWKRLAEDFDGAVQRMRSRTCPDVPKIVGSRDSGVSLPVQDVRACTRSDIPEVMDKVNFVGSHLAASEQEAKMLEEACEHSCEDASAKADLTKKKDSTLQEEPLTCGGEEKSPAAKSVASETIEDAELHIDCVDQLAAQSTVSFKDSPSKQVIDFQENSTAPCSEDGYSPGNDRSLSPRSANLDGFDAPMANGTPTGKTSLFSLSTQKATLMVEATSADSPSIVQLEEADAQEDGAITDQDAPLKSRASSLIQLVEEDPEFL
jgi:hypothetical protein